MVKIPLHTIRRILLENGCRANWKVIEFLQNYLNDELEHIAKKSSELTKIKHKIITTEEDVKFILENLKKVSKNE